MTAVGRKRTYGMPRSSTQPICNFMAFFQLPHTGHGYVKAWRALQVLDLTKSAFHI